MDVLAQRYYYPRITQSSLPGSLRFKTPVRGYRNGPQGTHGITHLIKTDFHKQYDCADYVRQNGYQTVLYKVPRPIAPSIPNMPRGGNVMRVVERYDQEESDQLTAQIPQAPPTLGTEPVPQADTINQRPQRQSNIDGMVVPRRVDTAMPTPPPSPTLQEQATSPLPMSPVDLPMMQEQGTATSPLQMQFNMNGRSYSAEEIGAMVTELDDLRQRLQQPPQDAGNARRDVQTLTELSLFADADILMEPILDELNREVETDRFDWARVTELMDRGIQTLNGLVTQATQTPPTRLTDAAVGTPSSGFIQPARSTRRRYSAPGSLGTQPPLRLTGKRKRQNSLTGAGPSSKKRMLDQRVTGKRKRQDSNGGTSAKRQAFQPAPREESAARRSTRARKPIRRLSMVEVRRGVTGERSPGGTLYSPGGTPQPGM